MGSLSPALNAPTSRAARIERHALLASWVLVAAAALSPIWCTRFLPLDDEPNHLSALFIWHELSTNAASSLHTFYETSLHPVPYALHYLIAYAFATVFGVELGHKLALCVYVLGLPLAASWLCHRTGRTQWLAFAAVPLAYTLMWAYGYHAFDISLVPCLLGVAAFDAFWERASARNAVAIAACTLACYLGHPIPLAMLAASAVVLGLMRRAPLRAWALAAAVAALPTLALLSSQLRSADPASVDLHTTLQLLRAGSTYPFAERAHDFARYSSDVVRGRFDTLAWQIWLWVCAALLLAGLWPTRGSRSEHAGATVLAYRSGLLAAVAIAFYLGLPAHASRPVDIWILAGRFAPLACFFFGLCPRLGPESPRRFLALLLLPIAVAVPLHISDHYRAFDRSMDPLPGLVKRCDPSEPILTLSMYPHTHREVSGSPFRFLSAWVQVLQGGGFSPNYWKRPIAFPFQVIAELPAPDWSEPDTYPQFLQAPYRCVVAHRLSRPLPDAAWQLLAHEGEWSVYRAAPAPAPVVTDKPRRGSSARKRAQEPASAPPAQP